MKKNKKGFTLIELLAVIIILGVLMLVAIPSVTGYISSSRRSSFASTASEFIKSVGVKVNQGEVSVYDENTLYLFPIGNDETKSCIKLESGGKSPFSDTYNYGYIGAVYDGTSYDYYLIAVDGAGQGFDKITKSGDTTSHSYIIPSKTLEDEGGDIVEPGVNVITDLHKLYANDYSSSDTVKLDNKKRTILSNGKYENGSIKETEKSHAIWTAFIAKEYLTSSGTGASTIYKLDGHTINTIVIIGLDECK